MTKISNEKGARAFLIATGNRGKCMEFKGLLGAFLDERWEVYDRKSFPSELPVIEETRSTFFGNAVKKAVETALYTGCCALADDSGLEVDALGGEPGVRSARFAGERATDEENNLRLQREMEGVSDEERTARFVAVVCLALPKTPISQTILERRGLSHNQIEQGTADREGVLVKNEDIAVIWFRGTLEGQITREVRGEEGFGYDPYFFVPRLGKTTGEMSLEEKGQISHRAVAVAKLVQFFSSGRPGDVG